MTVPAGSQGVLVTSATIAAAQAFIEPHEGSVPHMYLDTRGNVTVGVGNMLSTVQAALPLVWVWRDRPAPGASDPDEPNEPNELDIADEYRRICGAVPGLKAGSYRPLTRMDLPESEVRRLFAKRVHEFAGELGKLYDGFGAFPEPAQVALLDMAFNLGAGALVWRWRRLGEAVRARDWRRAATESHRPQSSEARNVGTALLFETAAAQDRGRAA